MSFEEIQQFIGENLGSLWELELLILVSRDRARSWGADQLNQELRASPTLISGILTKFKDKGLVKEENGRFSYQPSTPELERAVAELRATYEVRPLTVVKAVVSARDQKIQRIADAFKIKKD